MVLAVALCWANGLAARHSQLGYGHPHRGDYLVVTGAGLGTATILALGLVGLALLRAPRWLLVVGLAAAVHHLVLAGSAHGRAGEVTRSRFDYGSIHDGVVQALMPGAWPLLAVVLAAAVAILRPPHTRDPRPLGAVARATIWVSILLAALTGPAVWWLAVYFTFGGEAEPSDYQGAIVTAAGTAGVLLLAVLVVRVRWGTWSAAVPAVAGVLVQVCVVAASLDGARGPDPDVITPERVEVWWSLLYSALVPTSWPLLGVLLVAVVTGVRTTGQRSVSPDATTTAGPVSSTRSSAVQVTVRVPPGTSTR